MCVHFGWRHDFWKAPGADGNVMGWGEFNAFIGAMNRQNEAKQPDVGSWEGAAQDPWWANEWRKRAEMQAAR